MFYTNTCMFISANVTKEYNPNFLNVTSLYIRNKIEKEIFIPEENISVRNIPSLRSFSFSFSFFILLNIFSFFPHTVLSHIYSSVLFLLSVCLPHSYNTQRKNRAENGVRPNDCYKQAVAKAASSGKSKKTVTIKRKRRGYS